jgi:Big-like domain-containing protein/VCBS repeat protein
MAAPAAATGSDPGSIAVGDFNGDGILDLAVVNVGSNSLSVLLGNGNGTFTAAASLPVGIGGPNPNSGGAPSSIAIGDFNGDGVPDLAIVANGGSNSLILLFGDGNGTFTASNPPNAAQGYNVSIGAGDFIGNGRSSIVVGSWLGDIAVYLPETQSSATATGIAVPVATGTVQVMASYPGDSKDEPSTSGTTSLTAAQGTPTVSVTASPNPSTPGASVSLNATVTGTGLTPTGTVYFYTGNKQLGTVALNSGGVATYTTSSLPAGQNSITAYYAGDTNYVTATSSPVIASVTGTLTSTVTVQPSSSSITTTQALMVTVAVNGGTGNPTPTGTVTLSGGGYTSVATTLSGGSATVSVPSGSLAVGNDTLTATYHGDTNYAQAASSAVGISVAKTTPTLTVTPSASSITTTQALTVTVAVSGGTGNPAPTGTVTLSGGGYTSAATTLSGGSAAINIPAGSLTVGNYTLTVTYTPDASSSGVYASATQSTSVTVTVPIPIGTTASTVTVSPSFATITNEQSVNVSITVSGGSGQATPTGTVLLTGGTYSAVQALANGEASFTISAGTLSSGANTLTAAYSGDPTYASSSGTATVTISQVVIAIASPSPVSPGASATATATLSTSSTYSGTLNLTCTLSQSPTGAQSLPTCSLNPASVTITTGGSGSTVLTVNTTAASGSAMVRPSGLNIWGFGGGGALLAVVLIFGVPPRWGRWRSMLILFSVALAGWTIGCGGGGGGGHSTGSGTQATTAGSYTFTVVGTDSSNAAITTSASVSLIVQ